MTCCAYCDGALDEDRFGQVLFAIQFTPRETRIIQMLRKANGRVVPLKPLMDLVAGPSGLYLLINQLRSKLRYTSYSIENVKGQGYRLHHSRHVTKDITAAYRVLTIR